MSDYYDCDRLEQERDLILPLFQDNKRLHERAARYISAAGALIHDNYRLAMECTDTEKAMRFAVLLARRELPDKASGTGQEQLGFLSGVTPLGMVFYESTLHKLCKRTVIISDEYGTTSRIILAVVRACALELGHDIITAHCPFSPAEKIDHILIPALSLCFTTANSYHAIAGEERRIHARRFMSAPALRAKKQRLSFNRRAARELIVGACEILGEAKLVHDRLEKHYIGAMDFEAVNPVLEQLLAEISARAEELKT